MTTDKQKSGFKEWFNLMWINRYIIYFVIFLGITIIELVRLDYVMTTVQENYDASGRWGAFASIMGFIIGPVGALIVAYLGFYKFWQEEKNKL